MNHAACTVLVALILALPARAQEPSAAPNESIDVDTNLICDTRQQVERFVALFDSNKGSAEAAIAGVNAEHATPDACVIATAAYRRGEAVASVKSAHATFDVTPITVVGVYTVNGFERAAPAEFFTLFPREEAASTVGQRP